MSYSMCLLKLVFATCIHIKAAWENFLISYNKTYNIMMCNVYGHCGEKLNFSFMFWKYTTLEIYIVAEKKE